jgi:hypothetical protein
MNDAPPEGEEAVGDISKLSPIGDPAGGPANIVVLDPVMAAKRARLRHVSDGRPGITRH